MAERGSVKEVESFKSKSKSERSSKDDLQYLFSLLDKEENEIEEEMTDDNDDPDSILMDELRRKDERLTIEMFDAVLNPNEMLNVLTKKLQLYNEIEAVLKESRNKLTVGFMKVAVENRMMITQIKKDLDLQVGELFKRVEMLEHETSRVRNNLNHR